MVYLHVHHECQLLREDIMLFLDLYFDNPNRRYVCEVCDHYTSCSSTSVIMTHPDQKKCARHTFMHNRHRTSIYIG